MSGKFNKFLQNLDRLDRRIVFLIIGLVVLFPLLFPLNLPVEPTDLTQETFEAINNLPDDATVLISFEYGPSSKPEIHPMAVSVLQHCFSRGYKVIVMCLWPDGLFMAREALDEVLSNERFENLVYGVDYVNLGYRPGNEAVIKGITKSFAANFTVDSKQTNISEIPLMNNIRTVSDVDFIFSLSAGYPGAIEWVLYASDPLQIPVSSGNASIQVNQLLPYVKSGQMRGAIAGMPGAAEYEALMVEYGHWDTRGEASKAMDAQSIAHFVIVLFIILGNIAYYTKRKNLKKY
ncbi:MAG: hypothetical protein PHE86_03130 [Candidatus Marinimicrobia bacterium]|nr:hypothetical protein [Candidatus Neomarinimicrobiota bacterium]MDD5582752.1 hypothetical protein [Candidatus Neomarinimicrobiota bacterium]